MAERTMMARALALGLLLAACGDDGGADTSGGADSSGADSSGGATPTTGSSGEAGEGTDSSGAGETGEVSGSSGDASDGSTGEPVGPAGHFIAVGDGGQRVRSPDGVDWDGQVGSGLLDVDAESAPPDAMRALAVGDGYLVAVGGGGNDSKSNAMVTRSVDGGLSWQEDLLANKPDFSPHKLYGVAASGQVVIAAGIRGKRIRSEDGGLEWSDISFEDGLVDSALPRRPARGAVAGPRARRLPAPHADLSNPRPVCLQVPSCRTPRRSPAEHAPQSRPLQRVHPRSPVPPRAASARPGLPGSSERRPASALCRVG